MPFYPAVRRIASILIIGMMLTGAVSALADDADARMQPPIPAPTPLSDAKMQPPIPAPTLAKMIYLAIATRLGLPIR